MKKHNRMRRFRRGMTRMAIGLFAVGAIAMIAKEMPALRRGARSAGK